MSKNTKLFAKAVLILTTVTLHVLALISSMVGLIALVVAVTNDQKIPVSSIVMALFFLILPLAGVAMAIALSVRRNWRGLIKVLFGAEIPLFLLGIAVVLLVRGWSPMLIMITALVVLSAITLCIDELKLVHQQGWRAWKLVIYSTSIVMATYATLVWLFIGPMGILYPLSAFESYLRTLSYSTYSNLFSGLPSIGLMGLISIIANLLLQTPPLALAIFSRKLYQQIQSTKSGLRMTKLVVSVSTVLVLVGIMTMGSISATLNRLDIENFTTTAQLVTPTSKQTLKQTDLAHYYDNPVATKVKFKQMMVNANNSSLDLSTSSNIFNYVYCSSSYSSGGTHLPKEFCTVLMQGFNLIAYPVIFQGDRNLVLRNIPSLYSYIFDDSFERAERDFIKNDLSEGSISASFIRNLRGRAGTATVLDEDLQRVWMSNYDVASTIDKAASTHSTTYTMTLRNRVDTNQEVYLEFSLPTDNLITDLKLGPDLRYQGIIAPRGAAESVYQQGIRQNIDPAILTQVGPRTYRLRVFPVPANNINDPEAKRDNWDAESRFWRENNLPSFQKVQFTVSGVTRGDFAPVILDYTRNLMINNSTQTKFIVNGVAETDLVVDTSALKIENTGVPLQTTLIGNAPTTITSKPAWQFSKHNGSSIKCYAEKPLKPARVLSVYYDQSFGAGRDLSGKHYQEIITKLVEQVKPEQLNLYGFNNQVQEVFSGKIADRPDITSNVNFWGPSSRLEVANHMNTRATQFDAVTYIITDDSDFELKRTDSSTISFNHDQSYVSLIQIGQRLSSIPDAISGYVLKSGGQTILISPTTDLTRLDFTKSCLGTTETTGSLLKQLSAYASNLSSINMITDLKSRNLIARTMNLRARNNGFIDLFNSYIAVETDAQRRMLEQRSQQDGAFSNSNSIGEANPVFGYSFPEADISLGLMLIAAVAMYGVVRPGRKLITKKRQ